MTLSIVIRSIVTGLLVAVPAPFIVSALQGAASIEVATYLAASMSAVLGCLVLGYFAATSPKKQTVAAKGDAANGDARSGGQVEGREVGTVKWFNVSKGFGFITRASGEDVFVHYRSIRSGGRRTLSDGQQVEFVVTKGDKGLQAEDVSVVD